MSDVSQKVKLKILTCLDNDPDVSALVPPSSIFPMIVSDTPSFPFIRYGQPTAQPFEDSCGLGAVVSVSLHCFDDSEVGTQNIARAVQQAVSGLDDVEYCVWVRTVFVRDPDEASVLQAVVTFDVTDRD